MGRIFTGGDTIHTVEKFINDWKYPSIYQSKLPLLTPFPDVNLVVAYSNEIAPGEAAPFEVILKLLTHFPYHYLGIR